MTVVHAQDPTTTDPSPSPSSSPQPVESPTPSEPVPSVPGGPTAPIVTSKPTPTPKPLDPVFSTSDSCQACQGQFPQIRTCQSHIPVVGNLTMINQVLPFYSCICQNNGVLIDGLHQCSLCFASTGQQQFLAPVFHNNFSSQDVKAVKQVCIDTANGSKIPSLGSSLTVSSLVWTVMLAAVAVVVAPFGGIA
ncbi:hypothetical protein BGZ83_005127 [Gryganskiella cystojenkinii]|nr:hypothetical protein BGZ83_005127 [Gryganskiella cystojenkinii]